ncbi:MAG: leucine-rich repeat protein [Candidatus Methanomethylophilaceae archaeon]|jgi:uncharacterized repeat protein (TIGR02543 family)
MAIIASLFVEGIALTDEHDSPGIDDYASNSLPQITTLIIPDSITTIDNAAFWNCNNITSPYIGTGVTDVEDYSTFNCFKFFDEDDVELTSIADIIGHCYNYSDSLNGMKVAETCQVELDTDPDHGSVIGDGPHGLGSEISILAIADEGYSFVGWYDEGDLASKEARYTFAVTGDVSYTAEFRVGPEPSDGSVWIWITAAIVIILVAAVAAYCFVRSNRSNA